MTSCLGRRATTRMWVSTSASSANVCGTVEYFNRDSKNLLQDVPISMVTGFSSTLRNVGCINNHGVEVELSGDIIDSKGWLWSAGVNATFLRSEVKELYGGADIIWYDPPVSDSRAQYVWKVSPRWLSMDTNGQVWTRPTARTSTM